MDKAYDAVVIGGGHHGTIIAAYLAKAGMKVGVFERQDRIGGGAVTEDGPLPGYRQNFCAHFSRFYSHPAFRDFNLYDEGLHYVAPPVGQGIVFDDDTSLVGYPAWVLADPSTGRYDYNEGNVKKTYDQIANFSKTDAETYLELTQKNQEKWGLAFSRQRYHPLPPVGVPDAVEGLLADPQGGFDDVPGFTGLYGVLGIVFSWSPPSIPLGGTQAVTDALVSAGEKLGAEYFTNSEVSKVIVENGIAKGVTLNNGTQIQAKHLVVADTGVPQLLFNLLGDEFITSEMRRCLRATVYDRTQILHGCLGAHEPPQYRAAGSNPDVDASSSFRLYCAPKDLEYHEDKYWHEICLLGHSSRLHLLTSVDSIWDPTRAPEGEYNIWMEDITCPARYFSYREWRRLRDEYVDNHLLPQWRQFAPNMTNENIIGTRIYTPTDLLETDPDNIEGGFGRQALIPSQVGRFRTLPELINYRTPVQRLYGCSAEFPGELGIARGSSYCCYKVIAEDLGLPRFWEKV